MGTWGRGAGASAVLLTGSLLAGCFWQQPGAGPDHTRHNPFEDTLTAANVGSVAEQWSVTVPGRLSEPVASEDRIFATRNQANVAASVQAFDLASGATAWERTLTAPFGDRWGTPVAFSGDDLLVGYMARFPSTTAPECADLTRLAPADGAVRGTVGAHAPTTELVTADGIVAHMDNTKCLLTFSQSRLVVRDEATSAVLWTREASFAGQSPTIAGGSIYLNTAGHVAAYDAGGCGAPTCAPVWISSLEGGLPSSSQVAVTGGRVFVFTQEVFPLARPEGEDRYYVGHVYALDADTGAPLWQARVEGAPTRDGGIGAIAVAGDAVYAMGHRETAAGVTVSTLEAYDVAGCGQPVCSPLWSAPGGASESLAVAGGVVYATIGTATTPGALTAYDAAGCGATTCSPLATWPLPAGDPTQLAVSGAHVLVVVESGTGTDSLTAFGLP